MRVLSLVPSATEIVCALGAVDLLVGRTHECDHPAEAAAVPAVTRTSLATAPGTTTGDIDRAVAQRVGDGDALYEIDGALVQRLRPDVILAQDLCAVCAVPSGRVAAALDRLGCRAEVLSLDPPGIDGILGDIVAVGAALGCPDRARALVDQLRERIERVRAAVAGRPRVPVCAIEWDDPAFAGGHWVPEMIAAAGGADVLGRARVPSRRVAWAEVADARPEIIVHMPCGFDLHGAAAQGAGLYRIPEVAATAAARAGRIWAVDASAYFSRPGPRVVDGIEILAAIIHPGSVAGPAPGTAVRVGPG